MPTNIIQLRTLRALAAGRKVAVAAELATRNRRERRLLRLARRLGEAELELLLIMAARLAAETRQPPERGGG